MRILLGYGAALLVAGVLTYVVFFRASDEERIREKLERLSEAVHLRDPSTNPLFYLGRVKDGFREVFDEGVRVSGPGLPRAAAGRDELANAAVSVARSFGTAEVVFRDIEIKLDDARTSAQVTATAHLAAEEHGGVRRREQRPVTFQFLKQDGEWRISTVNVWGPEARSSPSGCFAVATAGRRGGAERQRTWPTACSSSIA